MISLHVKNNNRTISITVDDKLIISDYYDEEGYYMGYHDELKNTEENIKLLSDFLDNADEVKCWLGENPIDYRQVLIF